MSRLIQLTVVLATLVPRFVWAQTVATTVFIGGVGRGYHLLAEPVVNAPLQAANIGLYQHANGNAGLLPEQRMRLWAAWDTATPGHSLGEVGGFIPISVSYVSLFGHRYPDFVNMDIITGSGDGSGRYTANAGDANPGRTYTGYTDDGDLATMKAATLAARQAGGDSVAVFVSPNGGGEDLDDPFATSSYWANVRAIALLNRGMALDVPPTYWMARGENYQAMLVQMIRWANAHQVRSSLVISPYALHPDTSGNKDGCGYDPTFATNARTLVVALHAAKTFPSQWVVENYGLPGPSCGTENDVEVIASPNSLNGVALELAESIGRMQP